MRSDITYEKCQAGARPAKRATAPHNTLTSDEHETTNHEIATKLETEFATELEEH